jgi:hypothetical protein
MLKFAFRLFPILAFAALSLPVLAQSGPQSFDQYPSFIELTSATNDGARVVLRCGYSSPNSQSILLDPTFRELSILNEAHKSYSRIQRIDDYMIATSSDPTGGPGLLLELIKPDGSVVAKNCQTDVSTDAIGNCHTIQPFTFANQVKMGDDKIAQQCTDMMRESGTKVNPSLASVPKTEAFKATLRQKVSILASP